LSHETIANLTDAVAEEVKAWPDRPLEPVYPILYLDALLVKVSDHHQVRNKAAHIAVGVDCDGIKHVLGTWVQTSEGAKFWAGELAALRNRGVQDVLIACCDGLTGLPGAGVAGAGGTPARRRWRAGRPTTTARTRVTSGSHLTASLQTPKACWPAAWNLAMSILVTVPV
jgi:hypothetical protein